ncbi:MAG: FAD-dependent thymidylate synthase [Peptostreptococcaceae bacterium]|nr:FAD-dependent thymidylate synthase [Peptostreptococcaceae bacterium]
MKVKLLSGTKNPDMVIASAGKLCYSQVGVEEISKKLTQEEIDRFINMLAAIGHESPLEHVSYSFAVEGISRILEIQLVRHRIASYSIQSGRYVKRDNPEFIKPERIKNNKVASKMFDDIAKKSAEAYNNLFLVLMLELIGYTEDEIEKISLDEAANLVYKFYEEDIKKYKKFEKMAIEDARYVHLQSIGIKIVFTMNLRSLINFTRHRCCNRAQTEIRTLAWKLVELIENDCPTLGKNLGAPCQFGKCPEGSMCCGVPYEKR